MAIDILPIIKETMKLLRATIPATIEIIQSFPSDPMIAMADPTQIHQVLLNLCTNASQAMEATGGVMHVELADFFLDKGTALKYPDLKPGAYIKLSVSDTGHGMDEATMGRIFDPYFTTKREKNGSGLGLSVVHGIVRRHHGAVRAYSEAGKGSVFHVFIPKIANKPEFLNEYNREVKGGNERILLVDDEKCVLDIAKKMLEMMGYNVVTASSGDEAISLFREHPDQFDLIITDYTMPRVTGARLAEESLKVRSDIPILLCTGFNERINKEKAREIGIRELVMKPLTLHDLSKAVRESFKAN